MRFAVPQIALATTSRRPDSHYKRREAEYILAFTRRRACEYL